MTIRGPLGIAIALLALAGPALGGGLEAHLDRHEIALGETVQLLLRVRGDAAEAPDLAPLEADFDILDVRQSTQMSIVNGRRDASTQWWVELAPRRAGRVEIPTLRAGAAESESLPLEVASARSPEDPAGGGRAATVVAVEAEVDDPAPYVQGKVLLTLRVLAGPGVLDGTLGEPRIEGAVVERVGDDRQFGRTFGGVPYRVIERQYAVFPQRSGEIRVPPVVFEGRAREAASPSRRDPFAGAFGRSIFDDAFGAPFGGLLSNGPGRGGFFDDFFGPRGRPVRAYSEAVAIDVKPRPEEVAGDWFVPARHVELVEKWEDATPTFRVGEPVNRIVAIRATGLSGAQLPELVLPEVDGLKQYSEPAVDETFDLGDDVVAVKAQQTALIPTRAGELTLPALEFAWWDTEADEARVARLPERAVRVLPAPGSGPVSGAAALAAAAPATPEDVTPAPPVHAPAVASGTSASSRQGESASSWRSWTGTGIGALVVIVAIWGLRRQGLFAGAPPTPAAEPASAPPAQRPAERALRRACEAGDPGAASRALRELARARWPEGPPLSAAAWGERLAAPELARGVAELDRVQYSPDAEGWDGAGLWRSYRAARAGSRAREGGAGGALPSLYPARSEGV